MHGPVDIVHYYRIVENTETVENETVTKVQTVEVEGMIERKGDKKIKGTNDSS